MKLLAALSLLVAATAATKTSSGVVVVLDKPNHAPATSAIISPKTARLIYAQRLGLANDFELSGTQAEDVQFLDQYGGPRQNPLKWDVARGQRVLVVVDGVENTQDFVPSKVPAFDVSPAPHPKDTEELLSNLAKHAAHPGEQSMGVFSASEQLRELLSHSGNTLKAYDGRAIIRISSLAHLLERHNNQSLEVHDEINLLKAVIKELESTPDYITVTLALMPPVSQCSKAVGANKAYGKLVKRQHASSQSEFPLSFSENSKSSQNKESSHPITHSAPVVLANGKHFPRRYNSLKACQDTTGNCTQHGECKLMGKSKNGDRVVESFSCICSPQVQQTKDGKKTTYYGGPACQKKDVSAPFWLLAGTTVFLLTVITLGIGLLYSIGNEELPSVIGAGVSGPRAK